MCSHRLAIARLVRDYKDPLFSPVSSQMSRQNKQELWEHIRQQAVANGAIQYSRKSWKEIRDCVWAPIRRDTIAKLNKARTVGEDTVLFTEIDRVVLDIIGTNGNGGGTTADGGDEQKLDESGGGSVGAQMDENDNLNINALMAELNAAENGGICEFKPSTNTLSQVIGGMEQFAAVLGGQHQIIQINNSSGAHPSAQHHQQQELSTTMEQNHQQNQQSQKHTVLNGMSGKAAKRRAMDVTVGRAPSSSSANFVHQQQQQQFSASDVPSPSFAKSNFENAIDVERAIKQAQLEQIRLQNQLIRAQIEEKQLQNELLRIELQQKQQQNGGEVAENL